MKIALFALAGALALAACGSNATDADADGDGSISGAEARAAVEAAGANLKPQPGKYKSTMSFVKADIPGAPPQMKEMMGAAMNRSFEFCLTPEEAERGFEEAFQEGQEGCEMKEFGINGNDVNVAMSCQQEGAGTMNVTMTGNVTPTRSEMKMAMNGTMGELGKAEIEMDMVQERIGECDQ